MYERFITALHEVDSHEWHSARAFGSKLLRERRDNGEIKVVEDANHMSFLVPVVHEVVGTDVAMMQPGLP